MKADIKKVISIIIEAAKHYDEKLNDHHFKITYMKNGKCEIAYIGFRSNNYLHLTGVKTKLSAQKFYEACMNGKLAESDIEIDSKGKVQQKIKVLPFLHELLFNSCMIGDFINSGVMIKSDYFVGNTRALLAVGFKYGAKIDVPVSLYNDDVRKLTQPTCKVLMIQRKLYSDAEYSEITYIAKEYEYVDGILSKKK